MPPALVRIPSQRPLAPNVTSVAKDKGDNEMIPEAVHRSPGICLTAEENPGKPARKQSDERDMRPVFASNGVPFLQIRPVDRTSGRENEGKDRTGEGIGFNNT